VLFTTIAKAKMKKTEPDGKGTLVGLMLLVRSNQLLNRARERVGIEKPTRGIKTALDLTGLTKIVNINKIGPKFKIWSKIKNQLVLSKTRQLFLFTG
jgi:hypothetical protein